MPLRHLHSCPLSPFRQPSDRLHCPLRNLRKALARSSSRPQAPTLGAPPHLPAIPPAVAFPSTSAIRHVILWRRRPIWHRAVTRAGGTEGLAEPRGGSQSRLAPSSGEASRQGARPVPACRKELFRPPAVCRRLLPCSCPGLRAWCGHLNPAPLMLCSAHLDSTLQVEGDGLPQQPVQVRTRGLPGPIVVPTGCQSKASGAPPSRFCAQLMCPLFVFNRSSGDKGRSQGRRRRVSRSRRRRRRRRSSSSRPADEEHQSGVSSHLRQWSSSRTQSRLAGAIGAAEASTAAALLSLQLCRCGCG